MTELIGGAYSTKLSFQDRQRLRAVVKKVHLAQYPTDKVNDYEADKLIDALGPVVCQNLIEQGMQRGLIS
jgi:hypothetical protein